MLERVLHEPERFVPRDSLAVWREGLVELRESTGSGPRAERESAFARLRPEEVRQVVEDLSDVLVHSLAIVGDTPWSRSLAVVTMAAAALNGGQTWPTRFLDAFGIEHNVSYADQVLAELRALYRWAGARTIGPLAFLEVAEAAAAEPEVLSTLGKSERTSDAQLQRLFVELGVLEVAPGQPFPEAGDDTVLAFARAWRGSTSLAKRPIQPVAPLTALARGRWWVGGDAKRVSTGGWARSAALALAGVLMAIGVARWRSGSATALEFERQHLDPLLERFFQADGRASK